eukprot:10927080-Karenia_brevis.AAC.1
MSNAAPKKCCLAQMCYDKLKSGPQDVQWVILGESESKNDESMHDEPMGDATQEGPKVDPTVKVHNGDGTSGYKDEDMQ